MDNANFRSENFKTFTSETHTVTVSHVKKTSTKSFEGVLADFESQLGRPSLPDIEKALKTNHGERTISEMAGSSGLMILGQLDMGAALADMVQRKQRAIQFLVGNPLIANKMAKHNIEAALYAPLRILFYEQEQGCAFVYDLPSSQFGQWKIEEINVVAADLDIKLDKLITSSLSVAS